MAPEKTTVMVINADLQCPCCYKKIKKLLCRFPQIRDQVYDEKANKVTITVVCCSPEKIRDKLYCKGGKIIKSIDIKEPPPQKPNKPAPPPESEKPKEAPKPKEPEKPKEAPKPKEPEKPKEAPKPPPKEVEKPKEPEKPKEAPKPKEPEKPKEVVKPKEAPTGPPPQKTPEPVISLPEPVKMMPPPEMIPAHGFPQAVPTGYCCGSCHDGYPGGPCYYGGGYGRPVPPPPTYDYNYGRPCYVSRCDYFSEENPQGCSIM